MAKLIIYKSSQCEACKKLVPKITEKARKRGWSVKTVDIDHCTGSRKAMCNKVEFTPTLMLNDKEISFEDLESRLSKT